MKTIQTVVEVSGEGLEALLNKEVLIMCFNYFYAGILIGVNDTFIKLKNCHIVYETGAFSEPKYKDAQKIAEEYYIQISAIESFGQSKTL